ncbi:hypothetical protein PSEUBRA_001628 [Kalmanozyma brasiliensis GHG001]|uniref:Uncharacterized protein n=1 Tax=Kalmanozyma brasiliensis (strain GHG001) TaxID=1365824 RepID=V5EEI0_KALBG|nr:uncharacterized protein PSEUBRA_001628 [Kalmanozyma brasiliensis GHG001]EST08906.1 hypothetical protein PSEUBRA_001628 [Kalmanozyma brasiliensis GHG001]
MSPVASSLVPSVDVPAVAIPAPEIIFNVLPPADGKSALILLFLYCISLGAVLMELCNHIQYDIQLIRKPGWTEPAKLASRLAYLLCRILPPTCSLMFIFYLSLKDQDCGAVALALDTLTMFLLDAVMLIFLQRTMALYAWKRSIVVPLTIYYIVLLAASAVSVPFWGVGYHIPTTRFCAFNTRRHETQTIVSNLIYKCLSMGLDLTLLLLTLHRLLDGGLASVWRRSKGQRHIPGLKGQGISSFLIRQGFHFYVLQLVSDIFLVVAWFSFKEMTYQGLGAPVMYAIPPIAATAAFRDIGARASAVAGRQTQRVNEIMDSTSSPSSNHVGMRVTHATVPAGLHDPNFKASPATSGAAHPGRTTRIMWGSKTAPFSRSHHYPTEANNHGIRVTVGTVSRTEDVDRDWNHNSPRYSSDNADTIEMSRQQRANSSTSHGSLKGDGMTEESGEDSAGLGFDEIQVPTLARGPAGQ